MTDPIRVELWPHNSAFYEGCFTCDGTTERAHDHIASFQLEEDEQPFHVCQDCLAAGPTGPSDALRRRAEWLLELAEREWVVPTEEERHAARYLTELERWVDGDLKRDADVPE